MPGHQLIPDDRTKFPDASNDKAPESILLKEPFALKNSETVYFTSICSTPSYSDIAPIDNFDLTFFYFYFVFEVFDTIQF